MFCRNCGKLVEDWAIACPHCGAYTANYAPARYQTNVLAIVGLICSIFGYKKADTLNGNGQGLALAGIIISSIWIGLAVILLLIFFL